MKDDICKYYLLEEFRGMLIISIPSDEDVEQCWLG